jgi:hypothetical protein
VVPPAGEDTNTYVGYSPLANAKKEEPVWLVMKIDADGNNYVANSCIEANEPQPQPKALFTAPADLDYAVRTQES